MDLDLTPAARQAAERDLSPGQFLRIAFAGGCGAMGFRLAATRSRAEDDVRVDLGSVTVMLDRRAAAELQGATLDYDEDEGFLINHPAWGISC